MQIDSRQIENAELRELPEERKVDFEMMHEFRKTGFWPLQVGERHHSRSGVAVEKHWKLVHEVAKRRLRRFLSVIDL